MKLGIFAIIGYLLSSATTANTKHIRLGQEGDPCNQYNPCAKGFFCVQTNDRNECVRNGKAPLLVTPIKGAPVGAQCSESVWCDNGLICFNGKCEVNGKGPNKIVGWRKIKECKERFVPVDGDERPQIIYD
jgi:hypothetical protein